MNFKSTLLSITFGIFVHSTVFAQVKFGPEWTFTSDAILKQSKSFFRDIFFPTNSLSLRKWKNQISQHCEKFQLNCKVDHLESGHGGSFRVSFPDGWWYQIALDLNVLEVQSMPLTRGEFASKRVIIHQQIFEMSHQLGLIPHERIGGGHINMDIQSAFGGDSLLFVNFLIDQFNHPELHYGIFGKHLGNSPPLVALGDRSINRFKSIVKFYKQQLEMGKNISIQEIADIVEKKVYISNPFKWFPYFHYQAISLQHSLLSTPSDFQRLEFRFFRPQRNFEEFLLEIEFLEARLEYLRQFSSVLEINIPSRWVYSDDELIEKFKTLLNEVGLDNERFLWLVRQNPVPWENIIKEQIPDENGFDETLLQNELRTCLKVLKGE